MNTYLSGSLVRSTAIFLNNAGDPADPTVTTFRYRAASGSTVTPSIAHDATGVFHFDIDTSGWTGPGNRLYTCEWQGTGAVQAPGIDYFMVEPLPL